MERVVGLALVTILVLPSLLSMSLLIAPSARAQTDPPPFGTGDWVIWDDTVITDGSVWLEGNVYIRPGGSLTLENTTVIMHVENRYDYRFVVSWGAALYVNNGSYIGGDAESYVLYVEPDSVLRIRNSTISDLRTVAIGSSDAIIEDSEFEYVHYGVSVWGGDVVLRDSYIYASPNSGVWNAYGDIKVTNCTFKSNMRALKAYGVDIYSRWPELSQWEPNWTFPTKDVWWGPRNMWIYDNYITHSWSEGILVWGYSVYGPDSMAFIEGNTITRTQGKAISVKNADATVVDNNITAQPYGVYSETLFLDLPGIYQGIGWSHVKIVNNDITHTDGYDTYGLAVYQTDDNHMTGEWVVDDESLIDGHVLTRANITVRDGGHLTFSDHTMGFEPTPQAPNGITVLDGGRLDIENAYIRPGGTMSTLVYLEAKVGSEVNIMGSVLDDIGSDEADDRLKAVHSEGDLYIEDTIIKNSFVGLITAGGETEVHDSIVTHCDQGLVTTAGTMRIYNSTVDDIASASVNGLGGYLDIYNTTFERSTYSFTGDRMDVYWEADVMASWQNGAPIENLTFTITESNLEKAVGGGTDADGLSRKYWLREFTHTDMGVTDTTPHNTTGTYLGITASTMTPILDNRRIELFLEDKVLPWLNISSPSREVHQVNNTLIVEGIAMDNESGLDRVQWSYDMDLWNDVNGLEDWNFSVVMSYGKRAIYLRALDKAGNEAIMVMEVTIDKDPPALILLLPRDGFVTSLGTVLVEGLVEYGATVVIGSKSVACVDGTFRLSIDIVEGENLITVTAYDDTGNSNSTFVRVIRDTTPPEIVVTHPPDNYITNRLEDQNLLVSGYTEAGADLIVNGKPLPLGANGTFSFTAGLVQGLNIISIVAVDEVGNQNSTMRRVVFDRIVPELTLLSPNDGHFTNASAVNVKGMTSEPGVHISIVNGNMTASTIANKDGWFEVEVGIEEGTNNIVVKGTDEAGNSVSDSVQLERDSISPKILLYNMYDGKQFEASSVILEGETEAGARLKIDGELVQVGRTGKFSKEIRLPSSNNTVVLEAVDRAGNREVLVTHILRKSTEEPKPGAPSARRDYFPWAVLAAIVVMAVQGVVLTRVSKQQADRDHRKKELEEVSGEEDDDGIQRSLDEEEARPDRTRRTAVKGGQARSRGPAIGKGADEGPEFEEGDEMEDEVELEVYHGGDER